MNIRKSLMATGLAGLVGLTGCETYVKPKPGGVATLTGAVFGGPIGDILSAAGAAQAARGEEKNDASGSSYMSDYTREQRILIHEPQYTQIPSQTPPANEIIFPPADSRSFVFNELVGDKDGRVIWPDSIKGRKDTFSQKEPIIIGAYYPAEGTRPSKGLFILWDVDKRVQRNFIDLKIEGDYKMLHYNPGDLQPGNYLAEWRRGWNTAHATSKFSVVP